MQVLPPMSWDGFRRQLATYFAMDTTRRRQIIFRGHSDSRWPLTTTLDRYCRFTSDDDREQRFGNLLLRFRREMLHVDDSERWMLQGDALELMARHHGLPTPLLDWTESPYIAAFLRLLRRCQQLVMLRFGCSIGRNYPKDQRRL